jgi:hypothetical protein
LADWSTIASLATAGGTLVLATATFASIRSSNRAARLAEHAFAVNTRPVLMPSRLQDDMQKVVWGDRHWAHLAGGRANVEIDGDNIYHALSLRNVGAGIAVLQSWRVLGDARAADPRDELDAFRPQQLDLYVAAGDVAYWQASIRDLSDPCYPPLAQLIKAREPVAIELMYSDHDGGQRTITRFLTHPPQQGDPTDWLARVIRHWNLDRADPR